MLSEGKVIGVEHYTEILSDFVFSLKYVDLPRETVENTKRVVLDWYSASFAGMRVNGGFNALVKSVAVNAGQGNASVLCDRNGRYSEADAAFMNAVYAHGADMDDGNRLSMGHIAASVVSAALAVAENEDLKRGRLFTGEEIIVAINAGYEIFNRVAAAAQPGLVRRGFHSTGTAGGMACAAAVAKLLGLDRVGIYRAISLAALQSGGLIIIAESGQSAKPLNPANAARIGIMSARMAEKGASAPMYPLESEKGWFHAMTDTVNEKYILDGLGKRFTVDEGYLKPYPSCRHTHAPIQCALSLRRMAEGVYCDIPFEDIVSISVYTYENAIRIAGRIDVPKTAEDTKFSIQYAIAHALVNGNFGLDTLTHAAVTDKVVDVARRIRLIPAPEMEQGDKGIRGARVQLLFGDGKRLEETALVPKGDAASPLSDDEIKAKLFACSEGILTPSDADTLLRRAYELENGEFRGVNQLIYG